MPNDPAAISLPGAKLEALPEPEKVLAAYFSSSTVGLCVIDAEYRFLAVNDALAKINGLPTANHIGRNVREVLGDFADQIEPRLFNAFSTGDPINFEASGVLSNRAEPGHWIAHYLPIKDEAGAFNRIAGVVLEVTTQKKLEQSLEQIRGKRKRELDRSHVLNELSKLLSENWNVQQMFPRISSQLRRIFRHEYASFSLHDQASGLLVRQALDFPLGKGFISPQPVTPGNTPAGEALHSREAMIFTREQMQAYEAAVTHSMLDEGLQSLCCVPLLRPKGSVGLLTLGSTRSNAFDPDDLILLNQVAAQLAIALENHRAASEVDALERRLSAERKYLEGDIRSHVSFPEIVGDSAILKQVLDQVAVVAPSDATVLILGETGTGKELVARAIHRMSTRSGASFIKLNCAAIPTGLLESELFGHEKGAFTGAITQKIGRMELAHGGTLLLDEVGEIPLELQPKLLRVLQDQEFERLGSTRTIKVNVRLIAATNRDLAQSVEDRQFRNDLYYRLNVFPIRVPSLRERREDIPLLVRYFVRKFAQRMNRRIDSVPSDTMKALMNWSWPGNIRELENLMERSVILSDGNALRVPIEELSSSPEDVLVKTPDSLETAEREHIIRVLRETGGVLSGAEGAARRLGLKRTTLQSKMKRLKITRRDYTDR